MCVCGDPNCTSLVLKASIAAALIKKVPSLSKLEAGEFEDLVDLFLAFAAHVITSQEAVEGGPHDCH